MHSLFALIATVLLLLTASPAFADLVVDLPPTEETCRIDIIQTKGKTCEACPATDASTCAEKYKGTAFTKACQTANTKAWTEIWCSEQAKTSGSTTTATADPKDKSDKDGKEVTTSDKKAADLKTAKPTAKRDGCQTTSVSGLSWSSPVVSFLLGLMLLGVALRARR